MDRGRLVGAVELMDLPDADPGELAHTRKDLAWINRWLGGTQLVCRHLAPFALASLLLHHMEGQEQVRLLRELYRVARRAVLR